MARILDFFTVTRRHHHHQLKAFLSKKNTYIQIHTTTNAYGFKSQFLLRTNLTSTNLNKIHFFTFFKTLCIYMFFFSLSTLIWIQEKLFMECQTDIHMHMTVTFTYSIQVESSILYLHKIFNISFLEQPLLHHAYINSLFIITIIAQRWSHRKK